MTSSIKVKSHNYPVLVETFDLIYDREKNVMTKEWGKTEYVILKPEDGEREFYCTTTRKLVITDVDPQT